MRRDDGFRSIVIRLAGPVAEARHRRCSLVAVALGGGHNDYYEADAVVRFLARNPADRNDLIRAAEDEARRFVRGHPDAITELASTLLARRTVEFDDAPASVRAIVRIEGQIAPA
jgi:hypothetical protein